MRRRTLIVLTATLAVVLLVALVMLVRPPQRPCRLGDNPPKHTIEGPYECRQDGKWHDPYGPETLVRPRHRPCRLGDKPPRYTIEGPYECRKDGKWHDPYGPDTLESTVGTWAA
jgi:hypothetical protein